MGHQPRTKIVVWSMETTKYDEEVPKVVGIFARILVRAASTKLARHLKRAGVAEIFDLWLPMQIPSCGSHHVVNMLVSKCGKFGAFSCFG